MSDSKNTIIENAHELRCPECDGTFDKVWRETTIPYGAGEDAADIPACLPLYTCLNCGLQTLDEEGERLEHEAVCAHLGILSPREIKNIRENHGMTREEFAELTGIGESSIGRWERALNMQSLAYDKYLRLLQRPAIFSLLQRGLSIPDDSQTAPANVIEFPTITKEDRGKLQLEAANFSLSALA